MALIAIFGDTHFGVSNSKDFFLSYQEKFFREIFPLLKELGVTHFIHLGDLYDVRKMVNFKTLRKSYQFFTEALLNSGFEVHLIVGNHDSYYKNSLEINAIKELLGWSPFFIHQEPNEVIIDGTKILMVPWICSDNSERCMNKVEHSDAEICCGHFDISGFYMMRNVLNQSGLSSDVFDKFKRTFSGHFHIPSDNKKIMYVGSPYELSWADYGDTKRIVLYDTGSDKISFLENTDKIYEKIFYKPGIDFVQGMFYNKILKIYVDQEHNGYEFDLFLKKIHDDNPYLVNVIENASIAEDDTIHEFIKKDTLEFLTEYIDESTTANSFELKSLMQELYTKALELK